MYNVTNKYSKMDGSFANIQCDENVDLQHLMNINLQPLADNNIFHVQSVNDLLCHFEADENSCQTKMFQCSICPNQIFLFKGLYEDHMKKNHWNYANIVEIGSPNKIFSDNEDSSEIMQCNICQKTYASPDDLKVHLLIHTEEQEFMCRICNRSFDERETLNAHINCHSRGYKSQCEKCYKYFKLQHNLKRGHLIHLDDMPFQCEICGELFGCITALRRHKLAHRKRCPPCCYWYWKDIQEISSLPQYRNHFH